MDSADDMNLESTGSEIELRLYPGFTAIVTTLLGSYDSGPILGAEVLIDYLARQKIESTGPMLAAYHHQPGSIPPNRQQLDVMWVLPPTAVQHRSQVPWITVQEMAPQEVLAFGRFGAPGLEETMSLWETLSTEARRLGLRVDGPARRVFYEPRLLPDGGEQWTEMHLPVRRLAS